MNKERILQLAETIENLCKGKEKGRFDMRRVQDDCGSPSCIAGWAIHAFASSEIDFCNPLDRAQELLELETKQANRLFAPCEDHANCYAAPGQDGFVAPEHAAETLRGLAETGKVSWQPESWKEGA